MMRRAHSPIPAIASLVLLGACSDDPNLTGESSAPRPVTVLTQTVAIGTVVDSIEALGTARANESVTITANLTETVRKVHFDDGQRVAEGAVLVELTSEEEAALLEEARANLRDAERQAERLADLAREGLAPESQLDTARALGNAAQARLDTVVARMEDRLVRAPFAGVLGFREVSQGTLVSPGTAITTLDDISRIKLDFSVPELYLGVISPGDPVVAVRTGGAGRAEFSGVVQTIASRVDPVTRAATIRAYIDNADGALRPGMLLTVNVSSNAREAIVVPEAAVFQVAQRAFTYVIDEDDTAWRREVVLGVRRPGLVEITDGLVAGDEVVVEGTIRLSEGAPIRRKSSEVSLAVDGATAAAP
ncbi:MAG: efflux RND transporter periplasmic adaptor subunit [Pseudomonadota bacterium]